MSKYPHLSPNAAKYVELDEAARVERILSDRWIGYTTSKTILGKLEDLLAYPRKERMPNMLIVGNTNNGKTHLVKRFCNMHPAQDNPEGDGVIAPVLFVQAPPVPDEGRFYNSILELLFAPYRPSERVDKKQFQVLKLLRYVGLKILVIDEVHHILAGSLHRQRAFLNVLKYLSNELKISIVGVGTKDAFQAIQTDPQFANRFEPVGIPRWELNEEFLRLLVSFEKVLPLKVPSMLHQNELARTLFSMSEGYIGELSTLLNQAAVYAIKNNIEQITPKVLKEINWVLPSRRKRQLDNVVL
ncbi:TniB family NTP-binding protein [Planctobacterium marinum]|uniref:TniB family NTP-binding protein n=1 Tax=Planctobacterium marinum TaxID=1631968 RepID=UPI001E6308EE|nr:TniB family NTP-binding protein [Planctobacterium marinum]MCC2605613.1 TniB family NTP-binding protein [Planctobacterium marinum]